MIKKNLLYFLYGHKHEYVLEAKFSILTALYNSADKNSFTISVLTDNEKEFEGWPVNIISISKQNLAAWAGDEGYTHRRKACAIKYGLDLAEKSIFVDTDTIFIDDPAKLFSRIDDSQCIMDQFEFSWGKATKRREFKGLAAYLRQKGELPSSSLRLYNSGICGMSSKHSNVIESAINRIDRWAFLHQELHTIEQLAISFEISGLKTNLAEDCVYHYFSRKEFYHAMLRVFFRSHGEAFSPLLASATPKIPKSISALSLKDRFVNSFRLRLIPPELRKAARYYFIGRSSDQDEYMEACRSIWWAKCIKEIQSQHGKSPNQHLRSIIDNDHEFSDFLRLNNVAL